MFIEANLETFLEKLSKLEPSQKPLWGNMNSQRMVEHLAEMIRMSNGKESYELQIPEDRIEKMQLFLQSDKPMAKNIEVDFAGKDVPLRNNELDLAIDEFVEEWVDFEEFFESDETRTAIHPFYGSLNYEQWKRLHSKHFTHHFEQFNIV